MADQLRGARPEGRGFAPGSYCLAVCYCGTCPHYQPMPAPVFDLKKKRRKYDPVKDRGWDDED